MAAPHHSVNYSDAKHFMCIKMEKSDGIDPLLGNEQKGAVSSMLKIAQDNSSSHNTRITFNSE